MRRLWEPTALPDMNTDPSTQFDLDVAMTTMSADPLPYLAQPSQSVDSPEIAAEKARRRAARKAFFASDDVPIVVPVVPPLAPDHSVSLVERRTVTLSAAIGTPAEKALNLLVALSQLFELPSPAAPPAVPEAPERSKPDRSYTSGRPPILRCGEVYSVDGRGAGGFSSLTELARALQCSYPGLVAKWHATIKKERLDPDSHPGFEFIHRGHRVRIFPNYVPKI